MTNERRTWFDITFQAGNRPMLTGDQRVRVQEKLRTLEEVAQLAAMYERRGADAGTVRLALEQRVKQTRDFLSKFAQPLESAEDVAPLSGSTSAVSSGSGAASPLLSEEGPLDNVLTMPVARDAGDRCPRCGKAVSWADHLPPLRRGQSVRCFVGDCSRKVPDPA